MNTILPIRNDSRGYVALLAVLIVGAATTTLALGLLLTGNDNQKTILTTQQSVQARNLAASCIEEALQIIHDTTTFTGTNTLNLGQGTCTFTVTNTGSNTRTIDASGTINTVVRKVKVYATIGSSNISIVSWQEVADI